jgi:hypothetical protein
MAAVKPDREELYVASGDIVEMQVAADEMAGSE